MGERIHVAVRVKPLSRADKERQVDAATIALSEYEQIRVKPNKSFTFDCVFSEMATQADVYNKVVEKLIDGVLEGYNATVLAYGQTGSGKTFTMGTECDMENDISDENSGVIPRALHHLFRHVREDDEPSSNLNNGTSKIEIFVQFLELYNEDLRDLLNKSNAHPTVIRLTDDPQGGSIRLTGVIRRQVKTVSEALTCLKEGSRNRITAATAMNAKSSRSHAIFTVFLRRFVEKAGGVIGYKESKLHLVDLAGSERAHRTGATGERAKEGININFGLLALGNVITALAEKSRATLLLSSAMPRYIPYRDSKLTRLLSDSLGGNSRTLMIACVSASYADVAETLTTLKYADRVKSITNKVVPCAVLQEHVNVNVPVIRPLGISSLSTNVQIMKRLTAPSRHLETQKEIVSANGPTMIHLKSLYDNVRTAQQEYHQSLAMYNIGRLFHHVRKQQESAIFSTGSHHSVRTNIAKEVSVRENWLREQRRLILNTSSAADKAKKDANVFSQNSTLVSSSPGKELLRAQECVLQLEVERERLQFEADTRECLLYRALDELNRQSSLLQEIQRIVFTSSSTSDVGLGSVRPNNFVNEISNSILRCMQTIPEESSEKSSTTSFTLSSIGNSNMSDCLRPNLSTAPLRLYKDSILSKLQECHSESPTFRWPSSRSISSRIHTQNSSNTVSHTFTSTPVSKVSSSIAPLNVTQHRRRRTYVLEEPQCPCPQNPEDANVCRKRAASPTIDNPKKHLNETFLFAQRK